MIKSEGKRGKEINVIFCSDDEILRINQEFLKHNTFTDIITFQHNTPVDPISGELYISIDRVRENALTYNIPIYHEVLRVVIHGVLHLCGHGDKKLGERKNMIVLEDFFLKEWFHVKQKIK